MFCGLKKTKTKTKQTTGSQSSHWLTLNFTTNMMILILQITSQLHLYSFSNYKNRIVHNIDKICIGWIMHLREVGQVVTAVLLRKKTTANDSRLHSGCLWTAARRRCSSNSSGSCRRRCWKELQVLPDRIVLMHKHTNSQNRTYHGSSTDASHRVRTCWCVDTYRLFLPSLM